MTGVGFLNREVMFIRKFLTNKIVGCAAINENGGRVLIDKTSEFEEFSREKILVLRI